VERIEYESLGLLRRELADELVRREAFERLQAARKIVYFDKVGEIRSQLCVRFIEIALDRRVLDRAVHSLAVTIRPRMFGLGQAMVDIGASAGELERMRPESASLRQHLLDLRRRPVSPPGSVKCVPLSASRVWIL